MKEPMRCENEQAVLEAVQSGDWGTPAAQSLRAHAAGCAVCAEVLLVAQYFARERDAAAGEPHVPAAGLIWWKAQLRARREAPERATRPIAIAQAVTFTWIVLSLIGVLVWQWPAVARWLTASSPSRLGLRQWVTDSLGGLAVEPSALPWSYLLVAASALLLLTVLIVYIVRVEE